MAKEVKWLKAAFSKLALEGGYTQRQLAETLNISQPQVGRLLNIKSDFGRLELWLAVAAKFDYDLVDFLALGRSLVEGEAPPIDPEVKGYLDKARKALEGPEAELFKQMIDKFG